MHTFETAAVISLVDHLTAPLRKMSADVSAHEATHAATMSRMSARMADVGRHMTFQFTAPVVAGLKTMADKALEFSKIENTMQGVLQQRARSIAGLTTSTKEYAAAQIAATKAAADAAYEGKSGLPRGLVNVKEYMESVLAATKAGYQDMNTTDPTKSMAPAFAVANTASVLSLANRVGAHEAGDDIMSLANALNVHMRDKEGRTLPLEELNHKFGHIADVLSTMYTSSNFADHREVVQSLKMGAPLARFGQIDLGMLAMMSAAQKEAGFRGDESSIAQRSFINAFTAPKSSMYGALQSVGLNYGDFIKEGEGLSAASFLASGKAKGYATMNPQRVAAAFKAFSDATSKQVGDIDALATALQQSVLATGKAKNPIKPEKAMKVVDDYLASFEESVNLPKLILALRETGRMNPALWKQMGEGRQGARLLPFLRPPDSREARDEFSFEGERQYGKNWQMKFGMFGPMAPDVTPDQFVQQQAGIAQRQAAEHASKLEGAYTRFNNAQERVVMKLADSGAFEKFADMAVRVVDAISSITPKQAEMAVDLLAIGAAAGPALWALGTIGSVLSGIGALGGMLTGGGGIVAAATRAAPVVRSVATALERTAIVAEDALVRDGRVLLARQRSLAAAESAARAAADAAESAMAARNARAAEATANLAQRVAANEAAAAESVVARSRTMSEAMSRMAEDARAAARASEIEFDRLSGAAERGIVNVAEKYGRLERVAADSLDAFYRGLERGSGEGVSKMAELMARQMESALRSGDLARFPVRTEEVARAMGVVERAISEAAQAETAAKDFASKVLADQGLAAAAERRAAAAADELAGAMQRAARAAGEAAAKTLPADTARAGTRAATEAAARASDAAAKQAAIAEARAAEEVAAKQAARSAEFVAKQAAIAAQDVAKQAARRAAVFGVLGGSLAGLNPILDFAQAVEIGQARMEREHQVVSRVARQNGGVRSYAEETHGRYDPSYLEHNDAVQAAVIYAHAIAERTRVNPRDEGTRAFAASYGGVQTPAGLPQPQKVDVNSKVDVTGKVEGKGEVSGKVDVAIQPSQYFLGVLKRAEVAGTMALHGDVGGSMGKTIDMGGPSGVVQYPGGVHPAGR